MRRKKRDAAENSGWEDPGTADLRDRSTLAKVRATEGEERVASVEGGRLAVDGSSDGQLQELLETLEARLQAAEMRASEAEKRTRAFEDEVADGESRFRHRLGLSAGRKLAVQQKPVQVEESETEMDLRAAIARSLRAPLTRATGLTLSLQGLTESSEGKAALRQLSSSLRRLDQLAADLHDVPRIIDGSLPLKLRRTDLMALLSTTLDDATQLEDRLVRLDAEPISVRVDPDRARQIVEGMLAGARERTRAGAAILVRVRDTDAGVRVSVEDDNRLPAAIGSEMSLAVRLAELHGTEITVEGSAFRVVFQKDEA
jgi:hypothetical protein